MNKPIYIGAALLFGSLSLTVPPIAKAAPATKGASTESQRLMKSANTALQQKKWPAVVRWTSRVIALEAHRKAVPTKAYMTRARTYEAQGKNKLAIADYRRIPATSPQSGVALENLVRLLAPPSTPVAGASSRPQPEAKPVASPSSSPLPQPAPVRQPGVPVVVDTPAPFPETPLPADSLAPYTTGRTDLPPLWGWLGTEGRATSSFQARTSTVTALTFSPDGKRVATASWQNVKSDAPESGTIGTICLWNVVGSPKAKRGLQPISTQPSQWARPWNGKGNPPAFYGHFGRPTALAFSPGGALLASAGVNGGVTLWSGTDGSPLRALRDKKSLSQNGGKAAPMVSIAWSRDETSLTLWAVDADGTLFGWRLPDTQRQFLALAPRTLLAPGAGGNKWIIDAAFSEDGHRLAVGDSRGAVGIYDPQSGSRLTSFNNSLNQEIRNDGTTVDGIAVTALAFSPSGAVLASANFSHVYLNAVTIANDGAVSAEATSPLPPTFQNRLARLNQRVDILLWPDEESVLARSASALTALLPQKLNAPNAESDAAIVGTLISPRTSFDTQPTQIAISPVEELYIEAVPVEVGSGLRIITKSPVEKF